MARYATISSIAWSAAPGQSIFDAQEEATRLLRLAAVAKPDLIIFPELFLHSGQRAEAWANPDPLPNPITVHFSALAREYQTNLVIPMPIKVNGLPYNSAVVINRQGEIVGHYDKVHPTPGELEVGIVPGAGPQVHQLDFGRIGHAICYDLNFPHQAEEMQGMDVDIICFHSMFAGGQLLSHWALTVGAYVISAYKEESRVVDMTGRELMCIGNRYEQFSMWKLQPIMTARLNLDRRLFHVDYNVADYDGKHGGVHRLLAECADKVTIDHNLPVSVIAIGALEGVSLTELIERYGLETRNDFFRRAQGMISGKSLR
ncbi:MAG: carbon-nitrogen hydrolase family protein [Armatimonadota bacterium]